MPLLTASAGFRAIGLDADAGWFPKNRPAGLAFVVGEAHALPLLGGVIDAVTLHQTLEHVADPVRVLREIARVLKADGLLFLSVPNCEGLIPRLTGAKWHAYLPWVHRWHFSPRTLAALLGRMGFRVVQVRRTCLPIPLMDSRVKRMAYRMLNLVQWAAGMGDNLEVVAQKSAGVAPCLCGGASFRRVRALCEPYTLVECAACGLRQTSPLPMGRNPRRGDPPGRQDEEWARSALERVDKGFSALYVKTITAFLRSGTLLDIGCGKGSLPQMLAKRGIRGIGFDYNVGVLPKGSFDSLYYVGGNAESLPFGDQAFGAVSLNHVLEHFPDPPRLLSNLRRILKPGGLLFICVPNHAGLIPRLTPNWPGYIPWTHRWHFSPHTLLPLLAGAGFRLLRLRRRSPQTPPIESGTKRAAYRTLSFLQQRIGMGDELTLVAKKSGD